MNATDFMKERGVESMDIIAVFGGIEKAKSYQEYCDKFNLYVNPRLKQAIADYESIYSNDCEILDYPEDYTSPNCKKYDERVK